MRAYNIKWDLSDDEFYNLTGESLLPEEVVIPQEVTEAGEDDPGYIAEWLSDEYGFCVESFELDGRTECENRCPFCRSDFIAPAGEGKHLCVDCREKF